MILHVEQLGLNLKSIYKS